MLPLKLGLAWVTIVVVLSLLERSLIFFPIRHPAGDWGFPDRARARGVVVEDRFFTTEDGVRLHAWWAQAREAGAETPVLLWLHGNAGNVTHRGDLVMDFAALPARMLLVDYRGYGRSEGRPSEAGLYRDARAAWRHLTVEHGIPPEHIVVLGKSLGGAVAAHLAAEVQPAGLVIQSGFTSVPDVARRIFPFVPRVLIRTRMDAATAVSRVRCPVMVLHSRHDEVIPYELGRGLFDAAPDPKRFVDISPARHNDTHLVVPGRYFEAMAAFLDETVPSGPG